MSRGTRVATTAVFATLGALLATTTVFVAGTVIGIPPPVAAAVALALVAFAELTGRDVQLPAIIPQTWGRRPAWQAIPSFGMSLGIGLTLQHRGYWVALGLVPLASGSLAAAAYAAIAYGCVRAVLVPTFVVRGDIDRVTARADAMAAALSRRELSLPMLLASILPFIFVLMLSFR